MGERGKTMAAHGEREGLQADHAARLAGRVAGLRAAGHQQPGLHRREVAPPLVLQEGHGRLVGFAAVDLDRDVIARQPATVQPAA